MKHILLMAFFLGVLGLAEDTEPTKTSVEELDTPLDTPKVEEPVAVERKWAPQAGKLLTMGARLETAFSGGGSVQQGFSIPSIRLSAFGEAGRHIDYRLSVGQTREYSTQLLPQLLPCEAYVDLAMNPPRDGMERDGMDLRLRMGMMSPLFNPWWSADLGDLFMPDYHETHRALFLFREVGAELAFRPLGEALTIAVGAFNGSGIVSLNTNNSKAITGHIHAIIPLSKIKIGVGNGSSYTEQSVVGAINYKKTWASDFFVWVDLKPIRTVLSVDGFIAHYEDPSRSLSPSGSAFMARFNFNETFSVFSRFEQSNTSPLSGEIRNFQIGPVVDFSDYARVFMTYQALKANNADERSVQVRIRLTI